MTINNNIFNAVENDPVKKENVMLLEREEKLLEQCPLVGERGG